MDEDRAITQAKKLWRAKRYPEAVQVLIRRIEELNDTLWQAQHRSSSGKTLLGIVIGFGLAVILGGALWLFVDLNHDPGEEDATSASVDINPTLTAPADSISPINAQSYSSPTPLPTVATDTLAWNRECWTILPLEIRVTPADNGWQYVYMEFALENTTGEHGTPVNLFATSGAAELGLSRAEIVTVEGYRYAAELSNEEEVFADYYDINVPSGVRIRGVFKAPTLRLTAKIAQETHLQSLYIAECGSVSLQNPPDVTFPFGTSPPPLRSVGNTFEVGDLRITITGFGKTRAETSDGRNLALLTITLDAENLDRGYQSEMISVGATIFRGDGRYGGSVRFNQYAGLSEQHICFGHNEGLGPGQSATLTLCSSIENHPFYQTDLYFAVSAQGEFLGVFHPDF